MSCEALGKMATGANKRRGTGENGYSGNLGIGAVGAPGQMRAPKHLSSRVLWQINTRANRPPRFIDT